MSKITRVERRMRRAIDAFFEPERGSSPFEQMTYAGEAAIRVPDDRLTFADGASTWISVARSIFLFGPGVFFLFYFTLILAEFFPEMVAAYDEVGGWPFLGLFWILAAAFMTYAGAGTLTQVKNLAVPATVVAIACAVILVAQLFPSGARSDIYFWYSIYVFPFVLISAKLVQSWVSDK